MTPLNTKQTQGSALILALVMTIVLFIMGLAFLATTQTEKNIIAGTDEKNAQQKGIDAILQQINTILVEDLFGSDNLLLNGTPGTDPDEYYDYPGPEDKWLASIEPEIDSSGLYFWRQISDIYSMLYPTPFNIPAGNHYDPDDRTNDTLWNGTNPFYLVGRPLGDQSAIPWIYPEDMGTEVIAENGFWNIAADVCLWGGRADADGDGVADARWVKVPNLAGPDGKNVYAAVRIIDNCAMINLNTAYRYPDPTIVTNGSPKWDGTQLSHVNLNTFRAKTDIDNKVYASAVQAARYSYPLAIDDGYLNDHRDHLDGQNRFDYYDNDRRYEEDVAQRLKNPGKITDTAGTNLDYYYAPFSITDELELRNRYFLHTDLTVRVENTLPATFNPSSPVGKQYPYQYDTDLAVLLDRLSNWFEKAASTWATTGPNPTLGRYNRRHISTVYSYDRVLAPQIDLATYTLMPIDLRNAWENWTNWTGNATIIPPPPTNYRPICVNDLVYNWNVNPPTAKAVTPDEVKQLAAAIWMALPDSATLATNDPYLAALASLTGYPDLRNSLATQLAVNLIDHFDQDSASTHTQVNSVDYYGFESQAPQPCISQVAVWYRESPPGTVINIPHYAIELSNPSSSAIDLGGWKLDIAGTPITIAAGTSLGAGATLVVLDDATTYIPNGLAISGWSFSPEDLISLLDPQDRLADAITVPDDTVVDPLSPPSPQGGDIVLYESVERPGLHTVGNTAPIYVWDELAPSVWNEGGVNQIGAPASPGPTITTPIQIDSKNQPMETVAELYEVMYLATIKTGTNVFLLGTNWNTIISAATPDIHLGRLEPGDSHYGNLARYITVFHPFSDFYYDAVTTTRKTIDTDGDGLSEDPDNDGLDNDHNGTVDDPSENVPAYTDYDELAVPGRININTAPWFVIAQLPWIWEPSILDTDINRFKLAQAITAYRDKTYDITFMGAAAGSGVDYTGVATGRQVGMLRGAVGPWPSWLTINEDLGFANLGEVMNVTHKYTGPTAGGDYDEYYDIRRYGRNVGDDSGLSGLLYDSVDGVDNDLEERNVLFERISNVATVRSDTFTAYIAVRVGEYGKIRRVIAIFDRTNVFSSGDEPRLVALHEVPEVN